MLIMTKRNGLPVLNNNQKIFLNEYLIHRNATKAYKKAYPKATYNTARTNSARTLANANIKAHISKKLQEIEDSFKLSLDECLGQYARIAKSNMMDYLIIHDLTGDVDVSLSKLTYDQAAAIQSVTTEEFTDEETGKTTKKTKIKLYAKDTALLNYGKHLGGFVSKVEHSGIVELAQKMKQARERSKGVSNENHIE